MKARRRRPAESRHIAAAAFRLGGVFAGVALIWAAWTFTRGGSWWGPTHAFLAGTVLLAISGSTQAFTITAAASQPPTAAVSAGQRWLVGIGVALALVGVASGTALVVLGGGLATVLGLGLLAGILLEAIKRSLLRHFDLSSRFYLVAIGSGVVGVTLGALLGAGVAASPEFRAVHVHLNLVGLVGFTIVGTLPTILPTLAHKKAVSGHEATVAWWLAVASVLLMAAGLGVGRATVGIGAFMAAGSLTLVLAGVTLRLGKDGLRGGLPYFQVCLGSGWLLVWVIVDGLALLANTGFPPFSGWNAAVIVAGVGQVLLGSLAYLLPVLAGGPSLGRTLERAVNRWWVPLISANAAGVGLVLGATSLAVVGIFVWLADFGYRLARLEWFGRDGASAVNREN